LYNWEHSCFYRSPNINWVIKSVMGWVDYVAIWWRREMYAEFWGGGLEGRRPLGRGRHSWVVVLKINFNTFTAVVDLSRFNNSCLKSPASTLDDIIFQSCSFSFNQLRDLPLLVGNLYRSFIISSWHYPIHSLSCLHCDIMNPGLSLCSEGEWAVSGCSL